MSEPATPEVSITPAEPHEAKPSLWSRLPSWSGALATLIVLCIITAIFNSSFLSLDNWLNMLRHSSFIGIVAIGMTFVIILGGIDLSVGSLLAFAGGLGILVMNTLVDAEAIIALGAQAAEASASGQPVPPDAPGFFSYGLASVWSAIGLAGDVYAGTALAFVIIMAAAVATGFLNGALVAWGRIAPFIATLGGLAAYRSLALAMANGGEYRSSAGEAFGALGNGGIPIPGTNIASAGADAIPLRFPWAVVIFIAVALLAMLTLRLTRYGRHVVAIGCNEQAARYSAVHVLRTKLITYTLVGATVGVSAILMASRLESVSSTSMGQLFELDVIAAVVIGGTLMTGGSGSIIGTVIGVLLLVVVGNMLNMMQVSPYLQGLLKGGIIVLAVLIQRKNP